MIDPHQDERVNSFPIAWFASVRPDGRPHVVPVWFVHRDGDFWVASPASSRKIANVRANPNVTLAIDGTTPRSLVAEGTAVIHEHPAVHKPVVEAFAAKHSGFDVTAGSVMGRLILLEITVTRWLLDGRPQ